MYIQLGLESFSFEKGYEDSAKIKKEFGNIKNKILNEQFAWLVCRIADKVIKKHKFFFFNTMKNDQFCYLEQEVSKKIVKKKIK